MTSQTLDAEPACPAATSVSNDPDAGPFRAHAIERRSIADIPQATWDAPRRPQPLGDPVLRLGLPARLVGCVRRERPRGDPRRRPGRCAARRRPDRHRPADAPPRGRAGRRADPHEDAPRRDAVELTPVPPTATALFFGASYHADYATILAAPADLPAVADVAGRRPRRAVSDRRRWDVIDLRRLRCGDPTADALAAAFGAREMAEGWTLNVEREDVCPVVTLPVGGNDGRLPRHASARRSATRSGARSAAPRRSARSASRTRPTRWPTSRRSSSSTRRSGASTASSRTRRAAPRAGSCSGACSSSTVRTARCA